MRSAGVAQWQSRSFPSLRRGFDSLHPLQQSQASSKAAPPANRQWGTMNNGRMNDRDRKGYLANSAQAFAHRQIGRREFLRRLAIAGVGLSSFGTAMLG